MLKCQCTNAQTHETPFCICQQENSTWFTRFRMPVLLWYHQAKNGFLSCILVVCLLICPFAHMIAALATWLLPLPTAVLKVFFAITEAAAAFSCLDAAALGIGTVVAMVCV